MSTTSVIPLPPIEAQSDSVIDRLRRRAKRLDYILAGVVVAFAFLLASFAVRNADFWLHLATGRLIAQGDYQIGVDPFASTTAGQIWVNHAWLTDWLMFLAYRTLGDGIVVLKAILIALLAVVMMATRKAERGLWPAAVLTAIGLLAASPRLLLQPMLVSLLFEAITIWVLTRERRRLEWSLPVLFALWVNLDSWFFLGPLTVAIFAITEYSFNSQMRFRLPIFAVGLAACLLNPHHFRAFQLPMELSPAVQTSPLLVDVRFQRLFESPWRLSRYTSTSGGLNPAGLAYFALLGLGLLSFARNRRNIEDWRLPLWLAFAALGAFQLRLVPFFAVVAAPITAMNFVEPRAHAMRQSLSQIEFSLRRRIVGRFCFLIVSLISLVLSWPGWLQATPHASRHVAWSIRPEPSLKEMAEWLRQWYDAYKLSTEVGVFTNHPDTSPYLAWYCPQAKTTIDPRLSLFTNNAHEFLTISHALNPDLARDLPPPEKDWRPIIERRKLELFILHDSDAAKSSGAFAGPILDSPVEWPILHVAGKTIVFAWDDPKWRPGLPNFGLRNTGHLPLLNLESAAYKRQTVLPSATTLPAPQMWWRQFQFGSPAEASIHADTSVMYQRYFDEVARRRQGGHYGNPVAAVFAEMITSATAPNALAASTQIGLRASQAGLFVPFLDPGPPEAAILAIRHARLALIENPNDATAWLRLGQAYLAMKLRTREGAWAVDLPPLDTLRTVQIVTALENALKLDPDLRSAHHLLANVYTERRFLDAALEHRRREVELTRKAGPAPNEKPEAFEKSLRDSEARLREMEKQVQDKLNQYTIQAGTFGSKPMQQAQVALSLGLARKALDDILLKSDVRLFGRDGARLQLELLVLLGRPEQVINWLADPTIDENREELGFVEIASRERPNYPAAYHMRAYEWYLMLASAAVGDYDRAHRLLKAIDERTQIDADDEFQKLRPELATTVAAQVGASAGPEMIIYNMRLMQLAAGPQKLLKALAFVKFLRADLLVVSAILAEECANRTVLHESLNSAKRLVADGKGDIPAFAGRAAMQVISSRNSIK